MTFYKDQKASKSVPESTFRGEPPLILEGASADVASDYTKKKHVLRIKYVLLMDDFIHLQCSHVYCFPNSRLSNGAEFLLQAHDDAEMNQWVGALQAQCQTGGGAGSRSMTLPASSQKDETKRKSFFTLKKK